MTPLPPPRSERDDRERRPRSPRLAETATDASPISPDAPTAGAAPGGATGSCQTPDFTIAAIAQPENYRFCVSLVLTYLGSGTCYQFQANAVVESAFADLGEGITTTRAPVSSTATATGLVTYGSPSWYERDTNGQDSGEAFPTVLCGRYAEGVDGFTVTPEQVQAAVHDFTASCVTCR